MSIPLIKQLRRKDTIIVSQNLITGFLILAARLRTLTLFVIADVLRVLRPQVIEPIVLDCLPSRDTLVRIHLQHCFHQVDLSVVHNGGVSRFDCFGVGNLGEFQPLVARVTVEFILQKLRQRPQNFLNYKELVDLRVAGEKWLAIHELAHNAANSPNVDFFSVWQVGGNQEKLWGSVPSGCHVVSELGRAVRVLILTIRTLVARGMNPIDVALGAYVSREAEVANF